MLRTSLIALAAAVTFGAATLPVEAGESDVRLFKIVTVKDEVIVGLSPAELAALGASAGKDEVGTLAGELTTKGNLTVWRFAVRKNAEGALELAPLQRIALLRNESLRVEPYTTPLAVVAPK